MTDDATLGICGVDYAEYGSCQNFPYSTSDDEALAWAKQNYEEAAARIPGLGDPRFEVYPDRLSKCFRAGAWYAKGPVNV